MKYTHEMLANHINNNGAENEAYNYIEAGMTDSEIRADIEECLEDYEFEVAEDKETYIACILKAVDKYKLRKYVN